MPRAIIVCGAGISASAGIPTYRHEPDSLWNIHDMQRICTKGSHFSPESTEFYHQFRTLLRTIEPSNVHRTFARLQQTYGPENVIIYTQNIDDLLERAGCTRVHHIHGYIWENQCVACGQIQPINSTCECGGRCRPNIVFYGERGHYEKMITDIIDLEKEDILMLIGTSNTAINVDMIASPIQCIKVYVNPVPEPTVNLHKYREVLLHKAEDCLDQISNIFEKYRIGL